MRLPPEAAADAFCLLMDNGEVFGSIDPRYQSFSGIHAICGDIRSGKCEVYMYGTYDGRFGLVWCYGNRDTGRVELHLGFERGVRAEDACRILEREIIADHPWATELGSLIPAGNRMVQVLAVRMGYGPEGGLSSPSGEYVVYKKRIERDANERTELE